MTTATATPVTVTQDKTVEQLRAEFRKLRDKALQHASADEWMDAVKRLLPVNPTPQDWVDAAKKAKVVCWSCGGKGIYYGRGYVENGVFKGKTGPCYRCNGTGSQGQADFTRNWGYDNFHRRLEN